MEETLSNHQTTETPQTAAEKRTALIQRLGIYARFLKIEHTLFSLPLLFGGAVLASRGWPTWRLTAMILLAGAGARILALSLNRLIDMKIDRLNPRTATRELAAGTLKVSDALLVAALGLLVYVWMARLLSPFCLMWSWLPVLLFVIYPLLKRFTYFSHFGLGFTWAMAPLAGWFAVRPGFAGSWPAFILAVFSFFWLAGFDIIYATLDEEFDRQHGLFSIPAKLGRRPALRLAAVLHGAAFVMLFCLYSSCLQGVGAAFLMIVVGFLLFLEHIFAEHVNLAFFKINVIAGLTILLMVYLGVQRDF